MKNSLIYGLVFGLLGIGNVVCAKKTVYQNIVKVYNKDIPVTFQPDVTYIVQENLTGTASNPSLFIGANVSNVVLDFNQHELLLQDGQTGISLLECTNFVVKNGTITKAFDPLDSASTAIRLIGCTKITIEDMFLKNTFWGIFTDASVVQVPQVPNSDIDVKRVTFNLPNGFGIRANAIQGFSVEDCTFLPMFFGAGIALINNCRNVLVSRCNFIEVATPFIAESLQSDPVVPFLYQSENLGIDRCQFSGGGFLGQVIILGCLNTHITNSSFAQRFATVHSIFAAGDFVSNTVYARPCAGLLVDGCTFAGNSTGLGFTSFVTLGTTNLNDGPMRDVTISNSTFSQANENIVHFDILAPHIQGLLVDNCILDSTGLCLPLIIEGIPVQSANIHLGYPAQSPIVPDSKGAHDVIIKTCVLTGKNQAGIVSTSANLIEPNTGITVEDCNITAQEVGVLFANTTSSNVSRCAIHDIHGSNCTSCGIGILFEGALFYNPAATSSVNALIENIINNNGCGVVIRRGSQDNLLRGNSIFKNLISQIDIEKKSNELIDNVIFGKKGCCPCDAPQPPRQPVAETAHDFSLEKVMRLFHA